jgi:cytochrome P450
MAADDAYHAYLRQSIAPGFSYTAIDEIEPVIHRHFDCMIAKLSADSSNGAQAVNDWVLWAIADLMGELTLSVQFECLEKKRLHDWVGTILPGVKGAMILNQLRRLGLTAAVDFFLSLKSARMAVGKINQYTIDKTRARLDRELAEEGRQIKDFAGIIVRDPDNKRHPLREPEIAVMLMTLIIAGTETTSTVTTGM